MICQNCGKEFKDGMKFCTNCGVPIRISSDSAHIDNSESDISEGMTGKNPIVQDDSVNVTAGEKISVEKDTDSSVVQSGFFDKKKYLILIIIVVAAVAIGLVVKLLGNRGNNITDDTTYEYEEVANNNLDKDNLENTNDDADDEFYEESDEDSEKNSDRGEKKEDIDSDKVEAEVLEIREKYNQIMENYNAGKYSEYGIRDNVAACWDEDDIVIIMADSDVDDYGYSRYYYFSEGEIFFAYYEAADSYRFYFKDGSLIRIRYCEDAYYNDDAVNIDNPDDFGNWQKKVKSMGYDFVSEAESFEEYMELTADDYILPDSSTSYLTKADLRGLSKDECRIARNEIYARHGRKFEDETLQAYFNSLDWYTPSIEPDDFDESMLNKYEVANRDLIVKYEEKKGYR